MPGSESRIDQVFGQGGKAVLFFPVLYDYTRKTERLTGSPAGHESRLAGALVRLHRFVGADAVTAFSGADLAPRLLHRLINDGLSTEALAAELESASEFEAARQVAALAGAGTNLMVSLPGPLTLCAQTQSGAAALDAAGDVHQALTRAMGSLHPKLFLTVESDLTLPDVDDFLDVIEPSLNIGRHHNAYNVLLVGGEMDPDVVGELTLFDAVATVRPPSGGGHPVMGLIHDWAAAPQGPWTFSRPSFVTSLDNAGAEVLPTVIQSVGRWVHG